MKIIICISLFLLTFTSCGSSSRVVVQEKTLPSWYTNPIKSNSNELYALGEGKDKKEALAEALSFMASSLSVSVSSTYNAKTVVKEGSSFSEDARYESDIRSEVKKIRISHYEIVEEKSLGFRRYTVLIKSNKKQLFKSMNKELEQQFFLFTEGSKDIAKSNALVQLSFYEKQIHTFENLQNTLLIMSTLDENFDAKQYLQQDQKIKSKYLAVKNSISFEIRADKEATSLMGVVAKGLSLKGFKIEKKKSLNHFIVYIKIDIVKTEAYGFTLARSEVTFVTKDSKGTVIGSNKVQLVGQSSQGYRVAKQNLSMQLDSLMEKEGIKKLLNLPV